LSGDVTIYVTFRLSGYTARNRDVESAGGKSTFHTGTVFDKALGLLERKALE
jgi:hypothetical protein